jgi:hypothetical protein
MIHSYTFYCGDRLQVKLDGVWDEQHVLLTQEDANAAMILVLAKRAFRAGVHEYRIVRGSCEKVVFADE